MNTTRQRVLLINAPPIAIVEPWIDRADFPRDGLCYLAGYLRQFPDFEIQIVDGKHQRLDFDQVLSKVDEFRPDVVGLCAFTSEIKPVAYLAGRIKERLPQVVTVVGGPHITAIPEATLQNYPSIDLGVVGEGEVTFYELCAALRAGTEIRTIPGLCYRDGGKPVRSPARSRVLDQDSFPDPAFDMLPPADSYWVQGVRGCPFQCKFCMNHHGRIVRARSPERIVKQIEEILAHCHPKVPFIHFGDEIFTVDIPRTHQLMDLMIERGLHQKVQWDCNTHVRFTNYEILKKMREAGCARVDMGVESGDDGTLREVGKGTSVAQIEAAYAAAKSAGIPVGTLMVIGHPGETRETIQESFDLAVRLNPDTPFFSIMVPYPGTQVLSMAARGEGGYKLLSTDWDEYLSRRCVVLEFGGLNSKQIQRLLLWGYFRIFLYNRRFLDLVKFCLTYGRAGFFVLASSFLPSWFRRRSRLRPVDYDEKVCCGIPTSADELVREHRQWTEYQRSEMRRTVSQGEPKSRVRPNAELAPAECDKKLAALPIVGQNGCA